MPPRDPAILLSWVNTKLRDCYPDLESLCEDLDLDAEELRTSLSVLDVRYDPDQNRFR